MSKRSRDTGGASAEQGLRHAERSAQGAAPLAQQRLLRIGREGPVDADTKDFCGAFAAMSVDNSWDMGAFKKGFSLRITHMEDTEVRFEMEGVDPPIANALRRILIAEVETVAISRVTVLQNTGVLHDENLAHRLGLIPITFEPNNLKWKPKDSEFSERNSILFKLHAVCTQEQQRLSVYSGDLRWQPLSTEQEERFKDDPPRPVVADILITQLRAGQEIECECYCEKNVGKEHAKWSPVCTAYYKLRPQIEITKPILGDQAERLKQVCPMGVFDVEDLAGKRRAVVSDAGKCTTCRECIDSFPGEDAGLVIGKIKNHYLFSIESTGAVPAPVLFERAVSKLKQKCETAKTVLSSRGPNVEPE